MIIYHAYKKFISILNNVLDFICIIFMIMMILVVLYQVIMRQVFNNPPAWGEEVALLFMCWFAFIAIALGIKEDLHIGIALFVSKLPKKLAYVIEVIISILILVHSLLFFHFGFSLASFLRANSLPATGISVGAYYIVVAVAGILMALVILGKIADQIINRRELLK